MEVARDMAKITTDVDGSATITMADGYQLRIPGFSSMPTVNAQDVRNVTTALFALADNLDKRLAAIEQSGK
jgi:hypothetical protein